MLSVLKLGIGILIPVKGDSKTESPCEDFLAEGGLLNLKKRYECVLAEEVKTALLPTLDQFSGKHLHSLKLPVTVLT